MLRTRCADADGSSFSSAREKEAWYLATRNRARDHLIAAIIYSQMLCQLSYRQDDIEVTSATHCIDVRPPTAHHDVEPPDTPGAESEHVAACESRPPQSQAHTVVWHRGPAGRPGQNIKTPKRKEWGHTWTKHGDLRTPTLEAGSFVNALGHAYLFCDPWLAGSQWARICASMLHGGVDSPDLP